MLLNEGLETISLRCFEQCGEEKIVFPHTLRYVEDGAFIDCRSLKLVDFSDSALESIGAIAFAYSGLESFTAPPSLRAIGWSAFSSCSSLRYADLSGMQQR